MSTCQHCTTAGHDPHGCADRTSTMIGRHCTCGCGRPDLDPAPYWTQQAPAVSDPADTVDPLSGKENH